MKQEDSSELDGNSTSDSNIDKERKEWNDHVYNHDILNDKLLPPYEDFQMDQNLNNDFHASYKRNSPRQRVVDPSSYSDSQFLVQQDSSQPEQSSNSSDFSSQTYTITLTSKDKYAYVSIIAVVTVVLCCLFSQCMVRMSKACKLQLNAYYHKKKMEKNFLIQRYVRREADQKQKLQKEEEQEEQEVVNDQEEQNQEDIEDDIIEEEEENV